MKSFNPNANCKTLTEVESKFNITLLQQYAVGQDKQNKMADVFSITKTGKVKWVAGFSFPDGVMDLDFITNRLRLMGKL